MRFIFLSLFCLISFSVFSQETINFKGSIYEKGTKETIPGAHITVNKRTFVSDLFGQFEATLDKGKNKITISFLGYQTFDTIIDYNSGIIEKNFVLLESTNELDAIVVSDSKNGHRYRKSSVAIDIVDPELFTLKGTDNIIRAVDQLPSVHTIGDQINIRGGSGWTYGAGSRVLLMQDGVPMMEGANSEIQWHAIEPAATKQMEVLKGASSVLYGSSALNGTINIQTRRPTDEPYTHINYTKTIYDKPERESLHWYKDLPAPSGDIFTVYHDRRIKNVELSLSGHSFRETPYIKNDREDQRHRFYGKIAHDLTEKSGLRYGLASSYIHNRVGESFLYKSDSAGYESFGDDTFDFFSKELAIRPFIEYSKPNSKWSHLLNGQYYNVSYVDTFSNYSYTAYGNYQAQYNTDIFTGTVGLTGNYMFGESTAYEIDARQITAGAFAQLEARYKRFSAIVGGRYEYNTGIDTNYLIPVFRAGLNYEVNEWLNLKGSYGQAVRFPSLFEYFFSRNAGEISFFSNPELKPEKGDNFEIGAIGNIKLNKWNIQPEVSAFLMRFDNMTELSMGIWGTGDNVNKELNALGLGFKQVNVGETQVGGAEVSLKGFGDIGKVGIDFGIGYTYMNPIAVDTGHIYSSFTNQAKALAEEINNDFITEDVVKQLLLQIGSEVNYANTSTDPSMLKYRYEHLFKADLGISYKKFRLSSNVRYTSYMKNVDFLFESYIFNEDAGSDANGDGTVSPDEADKFKDLSDLLPGINLLVTPNVDILSSRRRNLNGIWHIDARLEYQATKQLKFMFGVENLMNKEYSIRPGRLAAPRRFVFQTDIKF